MIQLSTTKKNIVNDQGSVMFLCPSCGKHTFVRSRHERVLAVPYKCPSCGFMGPN